MMAMATTLAMTITMHTGTCSFIFFSQNIHTYIIFYTNLEKDSRMSYDGDTDGDDDDVGDDDYNAHKHMLFSFFFLPEQGVWLFSYMSAGSGALPGYTQVCNTASVFHPCFRHRFLPGFLHCRFATLLVLRRHSRVIPMACRVHAMACCDHAMECCDHASHAMECCDKANHATMECCDHAMAGSAWERHRRVPHAGICFFGAARPKQCRLHCGCFGTVRQRAASHSEVC